MWVMIMAPSSPTFSTCVCEMINRNLKRKRHEHFIALIADIWDCVNLRIRHYRRILRSVKLDRPKSRAIQFLSFQIPVITLTATRTPPCHPPRSSRTPLQDRDGRPTPPSPREQRFRQHRGWDSRTPGRDAGERHRLAAVLDGDRKQVAVAPRELLRLTMLTVPINWSDRVDHELGWQLEPQRDPRLARRSSHPRTHLGNLKPILVS